MQKLQTLIDMLTSGRKIHISIVDVSGVLNSDSTEIMFENVIHSKTFCNIAKSTECGYNLCLNCKKLANTRAINEKLPFFGMCFYGIFEAAVPVIIGGATVAVVYVGNAIINEKESLNRLVTAARFTGVDREKLKSCLSDCEALPDSKELFSIGEIVGDYLKMLYGKAETDSEGLHWIVSAVKRYAEGEGGNAPTLKELASIYHKNEKYMGRLFEREMGISYSKYCLGLRLERAEALLLKTSDKIIDIALECGFENISYFNRAFKERYGVSPGKYRKR